MYDLLIRGGRIADGRGNPGFSGDIAVQGGRIVEVGSVDGAARELVDAQGLLVTPGFVGARPPRPGQPTCNVATIVAGEVVMRGGAPTDARPGHRLRPAGPRA